MNFPQSFDAGPAVVVVDDVAVVAGVVVAAGLVYLDTFKTNKNQTNR